MLKEGVAVSKINTLTPEQRAKLVGYHDYWYRVGTSTERADRPKAEAAILAMRAVVGVTTKPTFVWCESPATAILVLRVLRSDAYRQWVGGVPDSIRDAALFSDLDASVSRLAISLGDALYSPFRDSLRDSLRTSLYASLRDSLDEAILNSIRDSLTPTLVQLHNSLRLSLRDSLRDSLGHSLSTSFGAVLRYSLRDSIRDSLVDSLSNSIYGSLSDSLRAALRDSLSDSLHDSLRTSLCAVIEGALTSSPHVRPTWGLGMEWLGQHESYWIAFYLYCRDVLGVQYAPAHSRRLNMWRDLAESSCWWWCFDNYVIISERPTVCTLENGRIHCATGPSVAFSDGFEIYAWRGTVVPKEWITEPHTVDPHTALNHPNIEQRRAAADILGWAKVLAVLQPKIIDTDQDPQIGELIEVDLPNSPGERFLRVRCGTGRDFCLPVPRQMRTALEANAWTFGVDDLVGFKNYAVRT